MKINWKSLDRKIQAVLKALPLAVLGYILIVFAIILFRDYQYEYEESRIGDFNLRSVFKPDVREELAVKKYFQSRSGNSLTYCDYKNQKILVWKFTEYEGVTPSHIKLSKGKVPTDEDVKLGTSVVDLSVPSTPFGVTFRVAHDDAFNIEVGLPQEAKIDTMFRTSEIFYLAYSSYQLALFSENGIDAVLYNTNSYPTSNVLIAKHGAVLYLIALTAQNNQSIAPITLLSIVNQTFFISSAQGMGAV